MNPSEQVLLVEDDEPLRGSCRQALEEAGYRVVEAGDPAAAEAVLLREEIDLVVTDLRMPGGGGQRVVQRSRELFPELPVVLITAYPTVESAIEAFKNGVSDYLLKPFTGDQLVEAAEKVLGERRDRDRAEILRRSAPADPRFPEMVGASALFVDLLAAVRRTATLEGPVLLTGETGCGKELAARAIHRYSRRADGPFVAVPCAALPESLVEAELFGFEKGAFTGVASAGKPGRMEAAHGGVLFLEEAGDLPMETQARLLRCIEEKAIRRVGGLDPRSLDVRILAATRRDLTEEVRRGRFRQDLYYRLSALEIRVPALRERTDDIPRLAVAFLDRCREEDARRPAVGFTEDAFDRLTAHPWPGNIHELQNVVRRAWSRARGPLITAKDLGAESGLPLSGGSGTTAGIGRRAAIADFERQHLVEVLDRHSGNVTRAAQALSIHRTTLQRLMRKHGLGAAANGAGAR